MKGWIYRSYVTETTEPLSDLSVSQTVQAPATPVPVALEGSIADAGGTADGKAEKAGNARNFSIVGLNASAWLGIQEQPSDTSPVLGSIPPNASGIEDLKNCVRQWCLVQYNGTKGFVLRRFLARPAEAQGSRYRIESIALDDTLGVFDFPGRDSRTVGAIPSYASGIVRIGDCDKEWCHIRYLGLVGWVSTSKLIVEDTLPR